MDKKESFTKNKLVSLLKQERALTASLNRYITTLEQNLDYQKDTVRKLREQIKQLKSQKPAD